MRRVLILGSTGSIGTQALDVVRANPRRFEVVGIAAGSDRARLDAQAAEFGVDAVALGAAEAEQPGEHDEVLPRGERLVDRRVLAGDADQ